VTKYGWLKQEGIKAMKLTFQWPNDNSTQDNEFIISDYNYVQCYYNELLPADNYGNISIPWDTTTANKLRLMKDDNIKVVISDDQNNPLFTGYIDSGVDFTKGQRLKPISLRLISPSFLLRQTIGETFPIKNTTVKNIVLQLLSRLNIVSNSFDIPAVIPVVVIQEDEQYYEVLETLLFEYGYVFDFDNTGKFTVLPIFNQPPTILTNIFHGGNIRNQVQETCDKKEYNYIRTKFSSVSMNTGDLVYEDKAEKEIPKGCYFGHESESGSAQIVDNGAVYCEYKSAKGELLWADVVPDNFTVKTDFSSAFEIEKTGTLVGEVPTYLGNTGTRYAFRAKNISTYTAKIKEIRAVGTSYTGITCYEISKSGSLLKEYDSRYLQDKSNAASFTRNLSNYYRYSSIKLHLESYEDFPYGGFVKVSETGIGEIAARIVRKTYRMNAPIAYELESVTDFTPASITGEQTYGNNSVNSSGTGPDIYPPSPPTALTLSLRDDGKVIGAFTKSPDDDILLYTVYRKTPDMPYKTVLTLDSSVNSFVDESAINGMAYTYKVFATDNAGNVSNASNEASIGTVTVDRPLGPASAFANAYEEYIAITIVPPELSSGNRDIYAPVEYKIQISRDSGATYSDVAVTANTGYDYYFDRTVDGYPEIGTLGAYRFRVYSVNIYGNVSATAFVCAVSTGDYATWIPTKPVVTGSGTGRTLYLDWGRQRALFGSVAYRIQISLDGNTWYRPATTKDPYASEDNWRENSTPNDFLETTEATFYQVVPLTGQNTDLGGGRYSITPKKYYYRVIAVNTESGKSSDWSGTIMLLAEGTGPRDLLNNTVGWDKIISKSILMEKLGVWNLIGEQATLSLIVNDINLKEKSRRGFQYWALNDFTARNADGSTTLYRRGEFRINTNTDDYLIIDPDTGISLRAAKLDMDARGTNVFGNLSVFSEKGLPTDFRYLFLDLVDEEGYTRLDPVVHIGNQEYIAAKIMLDGPTDVLGPFTAEMVTMTKKPAAYGGTLVDQAAGYVRRNITIRAGWYYVDMGGGGGGGGSNGGTGGNGGKLIKEFLVMYDSVAILAGGNGGSPGPGDGGGGGGGGGSSSLFIPELGILFCVSGGGGGGGKGIGTRGGGGGGGGAIGGGGGGGSNTAFYDGGAGGSGSDCYGGTGGKGSGGKSNGGDGDGIGGKGGEFDNTGSGGTGGNGGIGNNIKGGNGGNTGENGKSGGNNINTTLGGGGNGGTAGSGGSNGYVRIYKL
jgi:hypothetical protein